MICAALFCIFAATTIDGGSLRASADDWAQGFRLWGVQAPEHGEPGHDEATAALQALIASDLLSRDIPVRPTWGRHVVRCETSGGLNGDCERNRQGHAVEWLAYSLGDYAGCPPPTTYPP